MFAGRLYWLLVLDVNLADVLQRNMWPGGGRFFNSSTWFPYLQQGSLPATCTNKTNGLSTPELCVIHCLARDQKRQRIGCLLN